MGLIPIAAGLQALFTVSGMMSAAPAVHAAVPFKWRQFVAAARGPLPELFAPYRSAFGTTALAQAGAGRPAARPAAGVDSVKVQTTVQDVVRSILGADVGPTQPLMAAGLDSLGAVELQSSLEGQLGLQLPSTLVFDYPTVAALSEFLTGRLSQMAPAILDTDLALAPSMDAPRMIASSPAAASAVVMLGGSWRSPRSALAQLAVAATSIDPVHVVPFERWNVETEPLAARFGAYLADIAAFDAAAFATSDTEAALMDPQQRLLLETVGEALLAVPADAALAPMTARGVYVGRC
jgi:acyl carrier protein